MAVRNFYVEADVDGRATPFGAGPQSKTGGMTVKIYQRVDGEVDTPITINCTESNGVLKTRIVVDGVCVFTKETKR